jgi:hypothetical protein
MLAGCAGGSTFGLFDPAVVYTANGEPITAYLPNDEAAAMVQSLAEKGGSLFGRYLGGDVGAQVGGAAALTLTAWITGRGRASKTREALARAEAEATRKRADADFAEGALAAAGNPIGTALVAARAPRPGSEGADA